MEKPERKKPIERKKPTKAEPYDIGVLVTALEEMAAWIEPHEALWTPKEDMKGVLASLRAIRHRSTDPSGKIYAQERTRMIATHLPKLLDAAVSIIETFPENQPIDDPILNPIATLCDWGKREYPKVHFISRAHTGENRAIRIANVRDRLATLGEHLPLSKEPPSLSQG